MSDTTLEQMFENIMDKVTINQNVYNKFIKYMVNYNKKNNTKVVDIEKGFTAEGNPYYILINNNEERQNASRWLCDNE